MAAIKKHNKLARLSASALALPGIAVEAGEKGYLTEDVLVRYHHATYSEPEGYMDVTVDQVFAEFPINSSMDGSFTYTKDVTSGASPVVNFLDLDGTPYQILEAGASIEDTRDVYESAINYYGETYDLGFKVGSSTEDDYESKYISATYKHFFNKKNTDITIGTGYSTDDVWNVYDPNVLLLEPTQFNERRKREYYLAATQLLDRNSLIQFNITYTDQFGSLSDPYKKSVVVDRALIPAFPRNIDLEATLRVVNESGLSRIINESILEGLDNLFGNLVGEEIDIVYLMDTFVGAIKDNRPDRRRQLISVLAYSRYFQSTNSAIHADYRYIDDTWGTYSHTLQAKWKKRLNDLWIVTPGIRYYTQHSAHFYDVVFQTTPEDGYVSSDYRLAGFGTLSYKLEFALKASENVNVYVNAERYYRKHSLESNGSSKGHPIEDQTNSILSLSIDGSF